MSRGTLLGTLMAAAGFAAAAAGADDKPGRLVIQPKGVITTAPPPDESKFIVIRPQTPGGPKPGGNPSLVTPLPGEKKQPLPPVLAGPGMPTPVPVAVPVPVDSPAAGAAKADPDLGKIVLETWDTAYIKGQKVGHFHVVVREYEKDGKPYLYATKEQRITVARFGQIVEQWAEDSTVEKPDGTVLVTAMRQGLSKDQVLSLTGKVEGQMLKVSGEGPAKAAQDIPWPDGVSGIAAEANIYKTKKPAAGTTFDYSYYEGRLNRVVKITVTAKAVETVALVEGQKPRKCVRLEAAMEPIGNFKLPTSTIWCDAETFDPLRTDTEMPSLGGKLIVLRTSKEIALRPPGKVPDLFDVQSIRLDREIPGVHDRAALAFKVKLEADADIGTAFPEDDRQKVKNVDKDAKTLELHLTAVRAPTAGPADPAPGPEFLGSNFFIDWDTPEVKRHAAAAVAELPPAATAWDKARAVEKYVNRKMTSVVDQAMATASQTAGTLRGDCTEYAMFAAACCRANGVPTRTALGLVYAPGRDGKPYLAYHMWFEAFAGGHWVALDATLGRGSVGPGHVKIADSSWHNERSFVPLLPVLRVLQAGPKFEVLGR